MIPYLIQKNKNLYKARLLFVSLTNTFLNILFDSFNLMFKETDNSTEHLPFNSIFSLIDYNEVPLNLKEFNVRFVITDISDNETVHFEIFNNGISISLLKFALTEVEVSIFDFIKSCAEETINKFMQIASGDSVYETNITNRVKQINNIDIAPPGTFIKKISKIMEDGYFYRYVMYFEDGSMHTILSPNEAPSKVKKGDYGHQDSDSSFTFIPKERIQ